MTWFKLDDTFPDHPKVVAAGGQAAWLYVAGLAYCSRGLTDGHIPAAVVARLTDLPKPAELAAKLVAVGLWVEQDGGYAVHDYADHQRTRAQIDADRDRWKTQKRRQRDDTTGPMSAVDIPRTSRGVRGMSAHQRQRQRQRQNALMVVLNTNPVPGAAALRTTHDGNDLPPP